MDSKQEHIRTDDSGEGDPIFPESASFDAGHETVHTNPVFYDQRRLRWRWFLRVMAIASLFASAATCLLIVSLIALPLLPRTHLPKAMVVKDYGNLEPVLTEHQRRAADFAQRKERVRLHQLQEARRQKITERQRRAAAFVQQLAASVAARGALVPVFPTGPGFVAAPPSGAPVPRDPAPVVAAFYVNWEETSSASTRRNIDALTHFIPEWLHLKRHGAADSDPQSAALPFVDGREKRIDIQEITPFVLAHGVPILPLLNNYVHRDVNGDAGGWDTQAVHDVVASPAARTHLITRLRDWLLKEKMQGINIDFEEVDVDDRMNLVLFMKELYLALHPHGLLVTQDVQLENAAFDIAGLARWCDWIVPMFYDQHEASGPAGPVASIDWTRRSLTRILEQVPPEKIVLGVSNQGYNWLKGHHGADNLTFQSAMMTAKESRPEEDLHLDPDSLNPTFAYTDTVTDAAGKQHEQAHVVWMLDAVTVYNQLHAARAHRIRGSALWFIGAEDPTLWAFYNKRNWNGDWRALVAQGALNTIQYGGAGQVDFEGDGELLQPFTPPGVGMRAVTLDPKTGYITAEAYLKDPKTAEPLLPSAYVVRRFGGSSGNREKRIVLSFDDGPDPDWTPKILDILKKYQVPAVFFVVGKQAEENPGLLRRIFDEGHEIGNHSFTHPDMFRLSHEAQRLQLTMTQRIIQATTGRSTVLFRPPYGGDTEPQTRQQLGPLEVAAEMRYITVGEKNDPQDWRLYDYMPGMEMKLDLSRPRDYRDIVRSVVANRGSGSVVLLHDAGGDRTLTVRALPEIITQLRDLGYRFTTVADLRGVPRDKIMPPVSGKDILLAGMDRYVFEVTYLTQRALTTLFMLSILLGVSRIVLFVGLALLQRYRERRRLFPVGYTPPVSVVIAAYEEEKVIVRTVRALLDSRYPGLEILVVDDGSRDRTASVVAEAFADEPCVRVIRKVNGGKASALNLGILHASGEILISLDADTLFAPETIARLVRHFSDRRVAAVAGNVRVGNPRNLFTCWQSLEYITSQNFDRRGYDLLNCITVVPGAVGALRREAVTAAGGYSADTLAEDTDLTWKLRRAGWRIVNDSTALAYTEAPETLRGLARQRFRWAFGTLQCLWKHRAALFQHGAFGLLALPSLWVFQILFPAVSPFMDVAMLYAVFAGNFMPLMSYYLFMIVVEMAAALIALRMDRGDLRLLPWLFLQRFIYRQLMYYVILKSLVTAIRGSAVGWGKLERTGSARIAGGTV